MQKTNKFLLIIVVSSILTACFPIYKTYKPDVEVIVVDEQGQPIPNAKVTLITEVHPAMIDNQFDEKQTNQLGKVHFNKQAEWKVESLMIHGVQYYNWSLCVAKNGYETQDYLDVKKNAEIKITLKKGQTPNREYPYQC